MGKSPFLLLQVPHLVQLFAGRVGNQSGQNVAEGGWRAFGGAHRGDRTISLFAGRHPGAASGERQHEGNNECHRAIWIQSDAPVEGPATGRRLESERQVNRYASARPTYRWWCCPLGRWCRAFGPKAGACDSRYSHHLIDVGGSVCSRLIRFVDLDQTGCCELKGVAAGLLVYGYPLQLGEGIKVRLLTADAESVSGDAHASKGCDWLVGGGLVVDVHHADRDPFGQC